MAKKLRHRHGELYDGKQLKYNEFKGNTSLINAARASANKYAHTKPDIGGLTKNVQWETQTSTSAIHLSLLGCDAGSLGV